MRRNHAALALLGASTLLTPTLMSGCEEQISMGYAPSAHDIARPHRGPYCPVYIKIDDSNLLKIVQAENSGCFYFYKTSEGYGEYGIKAQLGGFGAGVDWSEGMIFTRISALEALALFDNDWTRIANPIYEQNQIFTNSVSPQCGMLLYLLANPHEGRKLFCSQFTLACVEGQGASIDSDIEISSSIISSTDGGRMATVSTQQLNRYLFIKLPDHNLLRVTQTGRGLSFAVTSSGYGVVGGEIHGGGNGYGGESAVANIYTRIDPLMVLALLDKNWQPIYDEAVRQNQIFTYAVEPELVRKTLEPLVTGRYTGPGLDPLPAAVTLDMRLDARLSREIVYSNHNVMLPPQYFNNSRDRLQVIAEAVNLPPDQELMRLLGYTQGDNRALSLQSQRSR